MSDDANRTPIQIVWLNYTRSVRLLLVPQPDDRPADQFLPVRDAVFDIVQGEPFLRLLAEAWKPFAPDTEPPNDQTLIKIGHALLLELQSFPRAVEVAQATGVTGQDKSKGKSLLDRAGTVCGSVKDIMNNLPPTAKAGLTLFGEVIDLFKPR